MITSKQNNFRAFQNISCNINRGSHYNAEINAAFKNNVIKLTLLTQLTAYASFEHCLIINSLWRLWRVLTSDKLNIPPVDKNYKTTCEQTVDTCIERSNKQ
uniref:Uncharacterized protein n=1 Tax=Glossina palpalis gambiensis TaxID=67801 RepID=A0A1B0AU55_9MUSC